MKSPKNLTFMATIMYFNLTYQEVVMTANAAYETGMYSDSGYQKFRELEVDEYNDLAVTYSPLPLWNPDVEALRLKINTREQTVVADTVAHDYGDDVDAYNSKIHDRSYEDDCEYRVMVYSPDPQNVEWVIKCYNETDRRYLRSYIEDLIIADKVYRSADDGISWKWSPSDVLKREYKERMVRKHLEMVRERLDTE